MPIPDRYDTGRSKKMVSGIIFLVEYLILVMRILSQNNYEWEPYLPRVISRIFSIGKEKKMFNLKSL